MHPKFQLHEIFNFHYEKSLILVLKILVSEDIYKCLVLRGMLLREFHCKSNNV